MPDEQLAGQGTPGTPEVSTPEVATATATPPEAGTETATEKEQPPATKHFTQDEVNEIVKRAKAAAESKTERRVMRTVESLLQRQQGSQPPPQQAQDDDLPPRREGESEGAYVKRLVQAELQRTQQQQQVKSLAERSDRAYAEAEKLPGFDREAFDALPLTPVMARAITESDVAPKLMTYLSQNPGEVERLSSLSPARQAAELGKLETKVSQQPKPEVKAPKVPAPIEPIGGGSSAPVKNPASMSPQEYYEYRMKQRPAWAR